MYVARSSMTASWIDWPICGAASPTPGASRIVSRISGINSWIDGPRISSLVRVRLCFRKTGSPAWTISSFILGSPSTLIHRLHRQFVISNKGRGGRRYLPYAFTEQGVAMLSSVLSSDQAIDVNIAIMRAFVRLRHMLETNEDLNRKFAAVIRKLSTHDKYFRVVFDELKKLTEKPPSSGRQIGFKGHS